MKFSLSISRTQAVCRNVLKNLFSSSSRTSPSQSTSSVITERKKNISSRRATNVPNEKGPDSSLYRRISPLGDPDTSIVPVLDQWVREGRKVGRENLDSIIKSLKKFRRFKHALEVSEWMTNKRYIPPLRGDIVSRLHLIYKVHGLEKAEDFYNNISQVFKGYEVDTALMNFYSLERSVAKTEAMMQKLQEMGRPMTALPYNILLNLYYNVGSWEKMDALTDEMEKKGIYGDKYSFTSRLRAYAATSDIEGLNRTMAIMESDPRVGMDCETYIIAANAFLDVGLDDKSLELVKKVEKTAGTTKGKYRTLNSVLRMYAKLGKKDEVHRIWKLLKEQEIYNTGYRNMIYSLLKFDDVEGAERIFKEWETKGLSYDFRIPDELIDAYVKKGDLDKAEVLLNHAIEKGGSPTFSTWYRLTIGYIEDNQVLKGVEAMKNATLCRRIFPSQEPIKDKLVIFLEHLERRGNVEEVEEFMNSLVVEGIFSSTVCGRLLGFIKNETCEY